jgi:pimeloyl-ACP methyl ester carboxylesterase
MGAHPNRPPSRKGLALFAAVAALTFPGWARAQADPPQIAAELLEPHLVDIGGGRRLNLHCIGSGSPVVVFEQGGEGFISNWARVQPAATALTRTCFYDRAGFGYSDPPDKPVTAISVTDDLHALLRAAGVKGPVVLVGHSVGGFYATMYADRFPAQVVGLVLVDPGFSGQGPSPTTERDQANIRRGEGYLVSCAALAREGRLTQANLKENRCYALPADATPPEARYILHAVTRPYWYEAEESQSVNYSTAADGLSVSQRQETEARHGFGAMPMIVLSSDIPSADDWWSDAEKADIARRWRAGHEQLAARSSRGRWIVVPGSRHFIQKDRPQAVIDAITKVVREARGGGAGAAAADGLNLRSIPVGSARTARLR